MHPIIKAYTEQIKKLHDEIDVLKQENIELEQRLDDEMLRTTKLATEIMSLEKEKRKLKTELDNYKLGLLDITNGLDVVKFKAKLEKIKEYFETTNIEYDEHKVMFDFNFKEIIESEEDESK